MNKIETATGKELYFAESELPLKITIYSSKLGSRLKKYFVKRNSNGEGLYMNNQEEIKTRF